MKCSHRLGSFLFLLAMAGWGQAQVVVGHVIPLSGVQAPTGKQLSIGAKAYIDSVNAAGGVNGQKISYVLKDDGYKPDETARLATELIEKEGALALLVGVGTANGEALIKSNVLKRNEVPMIGTRAGASSLYGPENEMIFHLWGSYAMEMKKIAKHCEVIGLKRLSVVYQNDAYGQDVLNSLRAAAVDAKISLTSATAYERGTVKVEDAVRKVVADSNSDAVVLIGVTTAAAEFVKQYRTAGGGKPIFGMSVYDPVAMIKAVGPEMMRGVGLVQVVPAVTNASSPLLKEFNSIMAKYGPKDSPVSGVTLQGFISAKVFVAALKATGPRPSSQRLIKALETLDVDLGDYPVKYGKTQRVSRTVTDIAILRADGRLVF